MINSIKSGGMRQDKKPDPPEAAAPLDKIAAPLDRRQTQQKLLGKIDERVASGVISQENRVAVAAYLLTELRDGGHSLAGEVEIMTLLRCGPQQMKAGQKRAKECVALGNTLGAVVGQIRLEMENPNAVPQQQKTGEQPSVEERLKELARRSFVDNPDPASSARRSPDRKMKLAIALIARWSLKKGHEESMELAGISSDDLLRDALTEGREEYVGKGIFYKKVCAICEELKIKNPF